MHLASICARFYLRLKNSIASETDNENPKITGRLKKAAGESQNQVASFIASSREEVSSNVDGEDGLSSYS